MDRFSTLINEQMQTMDKLIFLQEELERCQQLEKELKLLQDEAQLESIQREIMAMKKELREIYRIFEKQTEELIQSYHNAEASY